ncbi:hypothetical protein FD16_GL002415 [Paucilactobacillus suebicus DSM 5007 = KCTC 3549]|uniref:Uncharacterized protein n=1 Tax=Paucilactobacillus suebicus DSM 5007 = KCTC 3549 TaxID=1423807 RepID=A0A0R1W977_9LACO|nr:hypothetical protein FD16_GL002415 [Paucilactobacillus suebicus DSM 5007 = KCTC 3549]
MAGPGLLTTFRQDRQKKQAWDVRMIFLHGRTWLTDHVSARLPEKAGLGMFG